VETGKFAAKEKTANIYAEKNGYKYDVVFPRNIAEYKTLLLKMM
jgi:hypothetical protein